MQVLLMGKFIITIDQGTTGSRVFLINREGKVIASEYEEFRQYYPKAGWVEHDGEEIWESIGKLMKRVFQKSGLNPKDADSIGITNQRETSVLWDRATHKPVYKAIVWQCRRTADFCETLKAGGHWQMVQEKTGLVIDAYFSGTKIHWILNNVPGLQDKARNGEIAFGTMDSFLLYHLTSGVSHKTDYSNASRTMVFNIHEKKWDQDLLNLLDIPEAILPEVQKSSSLFGHTKGLDFLPDGIPIYSMIGDQQSALYGQLCHNPGEAKNTYGTGAFIVMNLGQKNLISRHGLVTSLACDAAGNPVYALEGSIFIAGAVIQFLRDNLKFFPQSSASEGMATSTDDGEEVVFVPAFAGLGAPHWDQNARGAILNLTRGTTIEHITKAALKSIAMQTFDVIAAMEKDASFRLKALKVDGGATANKYLMQFQAGILNADVIIPENSETTVLGAAYLAGLGSGFWKSPEDLKELNPPDATFHPRMKESQRQEEMERWHDGVNRVKTQA